MMWNGFVISLYIVQPLVVLVLSGMLEDPVFSVSDNGVDGGGGGFSCGIGDTPAGNTPGTIPGTAPPTSGTWGAASGAGPPAG